MYAIPHPVRKYNEIYYSSHLVSSLCVWLSLWCVTTQLRAHYKLQQLCDSHFVLCNPTEQIKHKKSIKLAVYLLGTYQIRDRWDRKQHLQQRYTHLFALWIFWIWSRIFSSASSSLDCRGCSSSSDRRTSSSKIYDKIQNWQQNQSSMWH